MFLPTGFNLPYFRFPVATFAWILGSVLSFVCVTRVEIERLHTQPQADEAFKKTLTYELSFVPAERAHPLRLITYQFMHISWGHLISNLWLFSIFGWVLENALGSLLFLMLALTFGALAVLPELIFQPQLAIPIAGASGTVAFLMGATLAIFPKSKVKLFSVFPLQHLSHFFFIRLRYLIYFWLLMQTSGLAMNYWIHPRPIAYATHLLGFALGLLVGYVVSRGKKLSFIDIDLTGKDLKLFYRSLQAYEEEKIEEANEQIETLSRSRPWAFELQIKLFDIAILRRQRDLADRIFRTLLPQFIVLRRAYDAEKTLRTFYAHFEALPSLQLQERVLMTRLLREAKFEVEPDEREPWDQLLKA